jgi:thiosulfate/3-mercaptopyruvate sulfurtransferase
MLECAEGLLDLAVAEEPALVRLENPQFALSWACMKKEPKFRRASGWLGFALFIPGILGFTDSKPERSTMPRSEWLVNIYWLQENLESKDLILVDTRSEREYSEGHIPGAIWLDLSGFPNQIDDSELQELGRQLSKQLSGLGITGTEGVVFYEEHTGTKAPRALWFLTYSGYLNGKVLHGGISAWREAKFSLSRQPAVRQAKPFAVRENSGVLASADYVLKSIGNPGCVILDVRSQEEYAGTDSPRTGHIPGARWLEWNELLDSTMNFRPLAELQKRLSDAGVTPDKEIITYCKSGSRSSNTYLALRILGYPRTRNYLGSWQEWSSRLDLPVEKERKETSSHP